MSVSFKFKSEHDFARHELEAGAASISAAALKKVIVEVKLNGSTGAFGLKLSNAQTGEEYLDDDARIPAEASVVVRRVPLSRPARGGGCCSAQTNLSGASSSYACASGGAEPTADAQRVPKAEDFAKPTELPPQAMPMQPPMQSQPAAVCNDPRLAMTAAAAPPPAAPPAYAEAGVAEDERIMMMMQAAGAEWEHRRPLGEPGRGGRGRGMGRGGRDGRGRGQSGPPPPGYVCHRCNRPGHWIYDCPGKDGAPGEPVEPAPRRAPVGIPKIFLQKVADDGASGGFQTADGSIVKVAADVAAFSRATGAAPQIDPAQVRRCRCRVCVGVVAKWHRAPQVPDELKCPISQTLFREPVVLPCCGASVSNDVLGQVLGEGDDGATCALCGEKGVLIDEVFPNRQLRDAVRAFLEDVNDGADAPASAPAARGAPAGVTSAVPAPAAAGGGAPAHAGRDGAAQRGGGCKRPCDVGGCGGGQGWNCGQGSCGGGGQSWNGGGGGGQGCGGGCGGGQGWNDGRGRYGGGQGCYGGGGQGNGGGGQGYGGGQGWNGGGGGGGQGVGGALGGYGGGCRGGQGWNDGRGCCGGQGCYGGGGQGYGGGQGWNGGGGGGHGWHGGQGCYGGGGHGNGGGQGWNGGGCGGQGWDGAQGGCGGGCGGQGCYGGGSGGQGWDEGGSAAQGCGGGGHAPPMSREEFEAMQRQQRQSQAGGGAADSDAPPAKRRRPGRRAGKRHRAKAEARAAAQAAEADAQKPEAESAADGAECDSHSDD